MFHYDMTQEDGRIIAVEHRVPLVGEELEYAQKVNLQVDKGLLEAKERRCLDKHDGTFDVLHVDALTGRTKTVNLNHEELAAVAYIAMLGDDGKLSKILWDSPEIKRYQSLIGEDHFLSFIP